MVREHRRERRELELFRPEIPTAPTPRPIPAPTPVPIPLPTPVPTPGPSAVDPAYAGPVGQVFRPRRAFRREVDRSKFSWLCCECSAHFRKPQLSGVLSDSRTAGCPADRRAQRANRMCFCDNIANSAISNKKSSRFCLFLWLKARPFELRGISVFGLYEALYDQKHENDDGFFLMHILITKKRRTPAAPWRCRCR